MEQYKPETNLKLTHRVFLTKEVYKILRKERIKQKISMAKIVCNLIIEKYNVRSK